MAAATLRLRGCTTHFNGMSIRLAEAAGLKTLDPLLSVGHAWNAGAGCHRKGRGEQGLQVRRIGRPLAEPGRLDWQASARPARVIEPGAEFVRCRRDDREAADALARRRAPGLPQAGHGHQAAPRKRDRVGLLACCGLLPFVKVRLGWPALAS
jgi:hypothetical protein